MRFAILAILALAACSDDTPVKSIAELQDPATCMQCHPKHYDDWAMSMHAYAADDPVFVALNKRGQRETGGALGTFCINCHAPMAVALGTVDATNAASFDPKTLAPGQRGITCYYCHQIEKVLDTHNNATQIALDQTMRGDIKNPVGNAGHHSAYSALHDGTRNDSSLCGSCHDVVTPSGVPLERSFQEWQTTIFAGTDPTVHLACNSACHMTPNDDVVADDPNANVPLRKHGRHTHTFAGVDLAMIDWPGQDQLRAENQAILDASIALIGPKPRSSNVAPGGICVPPGPQFTVRLDNLSAGHMFPSGAGQDRRAWLEVKAYDAANTLVFSNGVVPDGMDPPDRPLGVAPPTGASSPWSGFFWDQTYADAAKTQRAHFFWDVVAEDSNLLRPATTLDPNDPTYDHSTTSTFSVPGGTATIDRIEARVVMRPFAYDMLDALIASGDLDPAIRAKVQAYELAGTKKTWTRATATPVNGYCNPF